MPARPMFEEKLIVEWPPERWSDVTVVAAISGGADSVAMLRAMAAILVPSKGRIIVAHFNHELRGEASDSDEAFVLALAAQLGLSTRTGRPVNVEHLESEASARAARYDFLTSVARDTGARHVVTAHTADDQAETVLQRIIRGTGLAGLAGIRRSRQLLAGVSLLRPLLTFRRQEVLEYLAAIGQPHRTDSTNSELRFTRNRLRHRLLPAIEQEFNPAAVEALNRLARLAGESLDVMEPLVRDLRAQCLQRQTSEHVRLNCGPLAVAPRYLVRELMVDVWRRQHWPQQAMDLNRWEELAGLAMRSAPAETDAKLVLPGAIVAVRQLESLDLHASTRSCASTY